MVSLFNAIVECLTGLPDNFDVNTNANPTTITNEAHASEILHLLFNAEKPGRDLDKRMQDIVHSSSWTSDLAQRVLKGLANAINESAPMGQAMKEACDRASHEALEFVKNHPVFCTIVALGILVLLLPWAIEALGFAELGPVEGSFAASWQSTYAGEVPAGSLFAFFQRLGMVWH